MSSSQTDPTPLEAHLVDQVRSAVDFQDYFWHATRTRFVMQALKKRLGTTFSVTDLGAGAGMFGLHCRAQPGFTISYRFEEPIAALSRHLAGEFGAQAEVRPSDAVSTDAVVLLDVLEHQADDVAFLRRVGSRLARKDALVVVTVPALSVLWSEWDRKMGHHRRYTKGSLKTAARSAGFEILECRYLFNSMVPVGLYRRFSKKATAQAEFPRLAPWFNALVRSYCSVELKLGRTIPFGSSVAAVLRLPDHS